MKNDSSEISNNGNSSLSLLYGLNDKPSKGTALLTGFQHLLAVIGGILTAPLVIALGMGLSLEQTNYLITSALVISGVATSIQISRIGIVGSGLLSIQGTSFTFMGAIIFSFYQLPSSMSSDEKLATILGSCIVASLVMAVLAYNIKKIKKVFSPAVLGATIVMLGVNLVWTTLQNLVREFNNQSALDLGWTVILLSSLVFFLTLLMSLSKNQWAKLSSIMTGLFFGYAIAIGLGMVNFSKLSTLDNTAIPVPFNFGLGFDLGVLLILLPVFIVSATESIGDLTATSKLSGLETTGDQYWDRIRGGVIGDSINSLMAGFFATFPNTTFSQNCGVIQLTGIASRYIGYITAFLLVVLGLFPKIGGLFQIIPPSVIYGSTLLMFSLVIFAGLNILRSSDIGKRGVLISCVSIICGWLISSNVDNLESLPETLMMLLSFPVSTTAFIAMLMELTLPKSSRNS